MKPNDVRRVVSTIPRPPRDIVARFSRLYTGIVADSLNKLGVMHVDITPLAPGMRACGPAITSIGPDLTVRRMAIDLAQPGDVLVVAAGDFRDFACFGDGTAQRMMTKSLAGAVIDGCVRDAAGLRRLGFPTFSRGATARDFHYPMGADAGAVNVPAVCGGVLVEPGDMIIADDDGVVVVPQSLCESVLSIAEAKLASERAERGSWSEYPPFDVRDELEARGYTFDV